MLIWGGVAVARLGSDCLRRTVLGVLLCETVTGLHLHLHPTELSWHFRLQEHAVVPAKDCTYWDLANVNLHCNVQHKPSTHCEH